MKRKKRHALYDRVGAGVNRLEQMIITAERCAELGIVIGRYLRSRGSGWGSEGSESSTKRYLRARGSGDWMDSHDAVCRKMAEVEVALEQLGCYMPDGLVAGHKLEVLYSMRDQIKMEESGKKRKEAEKSGNAYDT